MRKIDLFSVYFSNIMLERDKLDSDSEQSSDDQLQKIKKNHIQSIEGNQNNRRKIGIAIIFMFIVVFEISLFIYSRHPSQNQKKQIISQERESHSNPEQTKILSNQQKQEKKVMMLTDISSVKQIEQSFFIQNGKESVWFNQKEVECLNKVVVNSASKISANLYLQKSAYQKINIPYRFVRIPAVNIYQFEGVRQFIKMLSQNANNFFAFLHNSPLLLILATSQIKKGLFVSNQNDWQLFELALILNDLRPLASPYSNNFILQASNYNCLITDNFNVTIKLLFEQKREIVILLEIKQPISVLTGILLKLKIYSIQNKDDCSPSNFTLYEESSWHHLDNTILMPKWYIFTLNSMSLPIVFKPKNYNIALKHSPFFKCLKEYSDGRTIIINSKFIIEDLGLSKLQIIKEVNKTSINSTSRRALFTYLWFNPIKSLYVYSGSYQIALLAAATLRTPTLSISPSYIDIKILMKNLVLNELEGIISRKIDQKQKQIIVVEKFQDALLLNAQKILINFFEETKLDNNYNVYTLDQKIECAQVKLSMVKNDKIGPGVYYLVKNSH